MRTSVFDGLHALIYYCLDLVSIIREPAIKQRIVSYLWFAYLAVLICWGISYYGQMIQFFLSNTLFAFMTGDNLVVSDFACQYNGATLARQYSVSAINIYDPVIQHAGILRLLSPLKPEPGWYLQYPPQFFALAKPLAFLSLQNAFIVWCGSSLLLIVWSLLRLVRDLPGTFSKTFLIVATLTAYPACFAYANGNTTLFHFPALVWYWLLLREKKYIAAGVVSAVFLIKLQFLPFLIPIGLLLGGWRYLTAFSVPSVILMLYTAWSVGWENIINYPRALEYLETHAHGVASPIMQNLRGELLLFLPPSPEIKILLLVFYGIGVCIVAAMWKWLLPRLTEKIGGIEAFNLIASITIIIMLIMSPHTHIQDYVALSIVAVFTYNSARSVLKIIRPLLLFFPIWSWITVFLFVILVRIRLQPYFGWACVFMAALVYDVISELKKNEAK